MKCPALRVFPAEPRVTVRGQQAKSLPHPATPMNPSTFQIDSCYKLTFIGDSNLHVVYKVTKRTAQFVTVSDGTETLRCKVRTLEGVEFCSPMGVYSMSPVLSAKNHTFTATLGSFRSGIGV